jgi:CRISPR system Cascade subunit CasD
MSCLLMELVGPMQSWGSRSRFQERDTEREPTKSGVIGLISAAFGKDRRDPVDQDIIALRMGVRVDREGRIQKDFHTAQDVIKADGKGKDNEISWRGYLADAAFLVGLEGDASLLKKIARKLENPVWPLYLGRKSFVPSLPILSSRNPDECIFDESLEQSLKPERYPLIVPYIKRLDKDREAVRLVLECRSGEVGERRQDVPVSFAPDKRQYTIRHVVVSWLSLPAGKEE